MHLITLLMLPCLTLAGLIDSDCYLVAGLKTRMRKRGLNNEDVENSFKKIYGEYEDELPEAKPKQHFKQFDKDNNCVLNQSEIRQAILHGDEDMTEAKYLNATDLPDSLAKLHFKYFDNDNNGILNENEVSQAFTIYDNDGNGEVSRNEFLSHFEEREGE